MFDEYCTTCGCLLVFNDVTEYCRTCDPDICNDCDEDLEYCDCGYDE